MRTAIYPFNLIIQDMLSEIADKNDISDFQLVEYHVVDEGGYGPIEKAILQPPFLFSAKDIKNKGVNARELTNSKESLLGITSIVRTRSGTFRHIPQFDIDKRFSFGDGLRAFSGLMEDLVSYSSEIKGNGFYVLDGGEGYHLYFDKALREDSWREFMKKAEKNSCGIDNNWLRTVNREREYSFLRITTSKDKSRELKPIAYVKSLI